MHQSSAQSRIASTAGRRRPSEPFWNGRCTGARSSTAGVGRRTTVSYGGSTGTRGVRRARCRHPRTGGYDPTCRSFGSSTPNSSRGWTRVGSTAETDTWPRCSAATTGCRKRHTAGTYSRAACWSARRAASLRGPQVPVEGQPRRHLHLRDSTAQAGFCTNTLALPIVETDADVRATIEGAVLTPSLVDQLLALVDPTGDDIAALTSQRNRLRGCGGRSNNASQTGRRSYEPIRRSRGSY